MTQPHPNTRHLFQKMSVSYVVWRHAAALALVGWYLLTPPLVGNAPNVSAPLSSWEQFHAFDTAKQCEQARKFKFDQTKDLKDPKVIDKWANFWLSCRCISTDDPRLKESFR